MTDGLSRRKSAAARKARGPGPCGAGASRARAGACTGRLPRFRGRLRFELRNPWERDRARRGPVESQVDPRVEARRDAEDADQRRGVCRPVADRAARHAGLGDRLHPAPAQTKGPLVPLLAVGPGPVPTRARGAGATTDTPGLAWWLG